MANYRYTLSEIDSNGKKVQTQRHILHVNTSDATEIRQMIYTELLTHEREERMQKLLTWYKGNISDTETLRDFVPDIFKSYVTDDDVLSERYKLLEQMCSRWEIFVKYKVKDIQIEKCGACATEMTEPDSHTECPMGCLHDPTVCWLCA